MGSFATPRVGRWPVRCTGQHFGIAAGIRELEILRETLEQDHQIQTEQNRNRRNVNGFNYSTTGTEVV